MKHVSSGDFRKPLGFEISAYVRREGELVRLLVDWAKTLTAARRKVREMTERRVADGESYRHISYSIDAVFPGTESNSTKHNA